MKKRSLILRLVFTASALLFIPPALRAADLCNNTNPGDVQNQPTPRNMACTFGQPVHVTQIVTYHWNNGRGKPPGTLALRSNATGQVYGPFPAMGTAGSRGAPNVNWVANVNICLPPGGYMILDSDWATWSMNAQSAYRGFVIVRGEYSGCPNANPVPVSRGLAPQPVPPPANPTTSTLPRGLVVPAPQPTPSITKPSTPQPAPFMPPHAATSHINCFLNSGAATPNMIPCKGPAGTVLGVYLPTQQHYTTMLFKAYGFADQSVPLGGSGVMREGVAPQSLCISPAPNTQKASGIKTGAPQRPQWEVYVEGPGLPRIGPVGGFSITGCGGKLPSVLPAAKPYANNTPPPGLSAIAPCYVNTYSIASVGPCFGTPGSALAVRIYDQKRGPFSLLVFKSVVINGVPAIVTAPLSGNGNLLTASAPIQLCMAKAPNKWQVWLAGPTKSLGEIGEFSITGCPP